MRRITGLVALALLAPACLAAQGVNVLHQAGAEHGFVVLRNASSELLASGEFSQAPFHHGMKAHVVFHFLDGSVDDETTVYSQHQTFRLVSDRHIQSGRTFPHPIDTEVDVVHQQVNVRDLSGAQGPAKSEHMDLPSELANGLLFLMIQNLQPNATIEVPYVAFAPQPRMVKLAIAQDGEEGYKVAGRSYKAVKYAVKVHLGGVVGVIAPMIGKQPPDFHVWVSKTSVPAILRIDGAFYTDGPVWSIQLATPVW